MIRYSLKCADGHRFDSWFASASAFDTLIEGRHVSCPDCGSLRVEKTLMAPAVTTSRPDEPGAAPETLPGALPAPGTKGPDITPEARAAALAELRRAIEATSDYVGMEFATEARRMHEGLAPERAIYGEARADEAKKLIEDGIPVAPLPFVPPRRIN